MVSAFKSYNFYFILLYTVDTAEEKLHLLMSMITNSVQTVKSETG